MRSCVQVVGVCVCLCVWGGVCVWVDGWVGGWVYVCVCVFGGVCEIWVCGCGCVCLGVGVHVRLCFTLNELHSMMCTPCFTRTN